ncbi:MAG: phosphopantetheine-binding protein [Lachnospiraceae bacterium]|nr:phosphopantetheine-binding protein [Lachnospiraceae bacterium]
MEELIEALKRVNPNIDYENEKNLVTDKLIDSIDMSSVLAELEDTFDIEIDMEYIVPENFDSVEAMWDMVQELMGE